MSRILHIDLTEDKPGSLSYELSGQERLAIECDGSEARVFANRKACAVLAKIFGKLAVGPYEPGFHIHLRTDFDDDAGTADALSLFLVADEETT